MNHTQAPHQSSEHISSNGESQDAPLARVLAFADGSRVVSHEQDGDVVEHSLLDANGRPKELLVYTASGSSYYFQPHEDCLSWGALLRTKPDGSTKRYELYGNETLRVTVGNPMEMPSSKLITSRVAGVIAPVSAADPLFESLPNDVISSANPFDAVRQTMSDIESRADVLP